MACWLYDFHAILWRIFVDEAVLKAVFQFALLIFLFVLLSRAYGFAII